jgi:hypothetical protein
MRLRGTVVAAASAAGALSVMAAALSVCTCSEGNPAQPPALDSGVPALDAPADGAKESEADAEEPWDPVWHETAPKDWPKLGPEGNWDCGAGCRVILHYLSQHRPDYGHTFDQTGVADVNIDDGILFHRNLSKSYTEVVASPNAADIAFGMPYETQGFIAFFYGRRADPGGGVRVMNLLTGEAKNAYSYEKKPGDLGVSRTALSSRHAFWMREGTGMMSRDLKTGQTRVLAPGSFACADICATDTALLCCDADSGRFLTIDSETGAITGLDPSTALQVDGACSPDRTKAIWIDYRDPPGQGSDVWFSRNGGEVYMKDLATSQVRRLTHDSPDSPRAKSLPAIGNQLVVWREARDGSPVNPPSAQEVYALHVALVVLDPKTSKRCRIQSDAVRYFSLMSVYGREVFGMGTTPAGTRLVAIDVDNPAIGCKPE